MHDAHKYFLHSIARIISAELFFLSPVFFFFGMGFKIYIRLNYKGAAKVDSLVFYDVQICNLYHFICICVFVFVYTSNKVIVFPH